MPELVMGFAPHNAPNEMGEVLDWLKSKGVQLDASVTERNLLDSLKEAMEAEQRAGSSIRTLSLAGGRGAGGPTAREIHARAKAASTNRGAMPRG